MAYTELEKGATQGILCGAEAYGQPYITETANMVNVVSEIKQDNFCGNSSRTTITQMIEDFNKLDEGVKETNILYKIYPEKETLMQTILEEMQTIKTEKESLDEGLLKTMCSTYNQNLEAAKLGYDNHLLLQEVAAYNSDPYELIRTFYSSSVGQEFRLPVGEVVNDIFRAITTRYTIPSDSRLKEIIKDKIDVNIIDNDGSVLSKYITGSLRSANDSLISKLEGRGRISSYTKVSSPPSE